MFTHNISNYNEAFINLYSQCMKSRRYFFKSIYTLKRTKYTNIAIFFNICKINPRMLDKKNISSKSHFSHQIKIILMDWK